MPDTTHYLTKEYIDTLIHANLKAMNATDDWHNMKFDADAIKQLSAFILFSLGPSVATMSLGMTDPLLPDGSPPVGSMVDITFWGVGGGVISYAPALPWPAALFLVADSIYHSMDHAGVWQNVPYNPSHLDEHIIDGQDDVDAFVEAARASLHQSMSNESFPPM